MPYWRLFYHIVWATKERLPLIEPEIETELHKVIAARGIESKAIIYAVGGIEDHIHVVASIPPAYSVASFVRLLKGSSSHFAREKLGTPFQWQSEYGVLTFGQKNLEWVVQYVHNQRQHHADKTSVNYMEQMSDTTNR